MITFDQARADPKLRQTFLDGLDLGDLRERVRKIQYSHTTRRRSTAYMDMKNDDYLERAFFRGKMRINVHEILFEDSCAQSEEDVCNFLYDHEGTHIIQTREGLITRISNAYEDFLFVSDICRFLLPKQKRVWVNVVGRELLLANCEIPAYKQQLNGKYQLSPEAREFVERSANVYAHLQSAGNNIMGDDITAEILRHPIRTFRFLTSGDNVEKIVKTYRSLKHPNDNGSTPPTEHKGIEK